MNKKTSSKQRSSYQEKYSRMQNDGASYLSPVDDVSDSDVRNAIFPSVEIPVGGNRSKIVTDAAAPEYNGPCPIGYREVLPQSIMSFKGPIGKALKHFGARNFYLGDMVNGWFDQNIFVNKADSMPGEDAVAAGYKIVPRGAKDKKLVAELTNVFESEDFNLDETLRTFEHHKRCYGAALMVPCFEEDIDMSVPLMDYGQFKGKTFLGWSVIEPYYLAPNFDAGSRELNDPTYKFHMIPSRWYVYGSQDRHDVAKNIHRSWIFFRRNFITSKVYQPMYKWQGPSIPQMILERLYSAEVCANESSMLLRSKRKFVMEGDIRKMTANPEWARKFLKNMSINADNWGPVILPRNSNAKQMDTLLTECMPLTTAQYGILCAEIGIPSPKFMMAQLTGFANSGNYEVKLYTQKLQEMRKADLDPIIRETCKILTACMTGKPIDFYTEFGDFDVPTVTEKAEILYEQARASKFLEEANAFKRGKVTKSAGTHHNADDLDKPSDLQKE